MATTSEVIREAFLHLEVIDSHGNPSAVESARGERHLTSLFTELDDTDELALPFTLADIPDWAFIGMSIALAGSLASGESRPDMIGEKNRGKSMVRKHIYGLNRVDDRAITATYY